MAESPAVPDKDLPPGALPSWLLGPKQEEKPTVTRPGPDWFSHGYAQQAFERHLLPLAGTPKFYALQIGVYCGDASTWLLDHVITHPTAWLVDVDTWRGSKEPDHLNIDFEAVEKYYLARMNHRDRFIWHKGTSDSYFAGGSVPLDFVYIDGDHTSEQVLRDAVNADWYLRTGGLLAFDDYQWWNGTEDWNRPGVAADAFLTCYRKSYEILEKDLQVWLRKVG